jgi:hydrogenase nickel incorporation protein HypA/HybF
MPVHEMGLALEILKATRQAARGRSVGHLEEVQVMVGELSSVEPDLLVFAWEAATKGSAEEGSALTVLWQPARQTCAACGVVEERAAGTWLRLCPRCDLPLQVVGGDELTVRTCRFYPPGASPEEGDMAPGQSPAKPDPSSSELRRKHV